MPRTRYALLRALGAMLVVAALFHPGEVRAQANNPLIEVKDDWRASWIWRNGDNTKMWVAFRKSITLDSAPSEAIASIAVESKYWLWVNGQPVIREGGLKRGPTPADGYYDEVDLAPYLVQGDNLIAILVWYWGRSGYSHAAADRAGLLFEADIDGQLVVSDASWKSLRMFALRDSGPPVPNFRLPERNVGFDAEQDVGAWMMPGYNAGGWPESAVVGTGGGPPWNRTYRRPIPQWRWSDLRPFRNQPQFPIVSTGDTLEMELPAHAHVTPYLKIRAAAGDTVDMRTDRFEIPSIDGVTKVNSVRAAYMTTDGEQEFETYGWMNGQTVRYHFPAGIEILDLKYRESKFDTDYVGGFTVDDPFLNTLWVKARNTVHGTMRDYFMETAGRERKQATADGARAIGAALYSMDDRSHSLMRKFWSEFSDWRTAQGAFLSGVPGDWIREQPQQNLLAYGEYGLWHYVLFTGDREVLEYVYPHVRRYLLLWEFEPSGLVVHRAGDWDFFDWEHNIDEPLIENSLYQIALRAAIRMAIATGNQSDIPEWERRREIIQAAVNQHFWQGSFYRSPDHDGPPDDRGNALAYLAGISEDSFKDDLNALLRSEMHASPNMDHYVLRALFEMGDAEGAIARMKERYATMVYHPSTTLREYWDPTIGSLEHPFASGTLQLLSSFVGGIVPLEPGFALAKIEPSPGGLNDVKAEVMTPNGMLSVDLVRAAVVGDDNLAQTMTVKIPDGVTGRVGIPKPPGALARIESGGAVIWLEDAPLESVTGLRPIVETESVVRFEAAAGEWTFDVYIKPVPASFTDIQTRQEGGEALVSWETVRERDDTEFVVEEWINGEFMPVGFWAGVGSGGGRYEFAVGDPSPGLRKFRIKAVGAEGGIAYSAEVVFDVPMDVEIAVTEFFPNPVDQVATVSVAVREPHEVRAVIFDALGRTVKTAFTSYLEPGTRYRYQVEVGDLPSGIYGLVLNGKTSTARRFVIAR